MVLAICIPTHHGRAELLREAIESVVSQLDGLEDEVQISISDNASHDGTAEMVADYQQRFGDRVRYRRNERNLGYLPNFLAVVEQADADFCWLLGSDDTIAPGGVAGVVDLLERHPDLAGATLNRSRVDFRWPDVVRSDPPDELPEDAGSEHVYRSVEDAFRHCGLAIDYMSTQVVRRQGWRDAVAEIGPEALGATILAHMLIIGRMVQRNPAWAWHPPAVVRHRTGTSELDERLGHRYSAYQLMIMDERSKVWAAILGKGSPAWRAAMHKAYRRTANPYATSRYKLEAHHDWRADLQLLRLVRHFRWLPEFWLRTFPLLLLPYQLMPWLKRASELMDRATGRPVQNRL